MRSSLASALLLTACTFPEIEIVGQGGGPETSSSTTIGTGATAGSLSTTATGTVECDDDMDGAMVADPSCCTVPAECDCNDDDDEVFPGQPAWFFEKRADKADGAIDAFDYDCSGASEEQWPEGDCATLGACMSGSTLEVFQPIDAYACGANGRRRYCNGATCEQPLVMLGCH